MSSNEDHEHLSGKAKAYLDLICIILKTNPNFILTLPTDMAIKIILLLSLEEENMPTVENIVEKLCDKNGKEFLDKLQTAVNDPDKFFRENERL